MSKNKTTFGVFESIICKGESAALKGWWAAFDECEALGLSVSAYAEEAAKVATRNTAGTIRQYIGAVKRCAGLGYTLDEFVAEGMGIDHVRATAAANATRKGKGKKAEVTPVDKAREAVHALTTAEAKKLIKALAAELGLHVI
jgi:hypothetical protein